MMLIPSTCFCTRCHACRSRPISFSAWYFPLFKLGNESPVMLPRSTITLNSLFFKKASFPSWNATFAVSFITNGPLNGMLFYYLPDQRGKYVCGGVCEKKQTVFYIKSDSYLDAVDRSLLTSWDAQRKCNLSVHWQMNGKKLWYIYTMEYYSAIKRNEIESFVETCMDLETVIQSEVSQKEKNKYRILKHICGT